MQKILVIDDDELHRRLLYDVLSAKDYEVLLADRGTRGIDLARENRPQLILLYQFSLIRTDVPNCAGRWT
jgi:DNA-binding response OmpR family regulator